MTTPAPRTLALPVVDPAARAAGLAQLKKDRAEAEQLLETVPAWDAQFAVAVGAILIQALRTHDALKAERDRMVDPIYRAYKNASDTYAADLKESEALVKALRAAVGAYELKAHVEKHAALQAAQAAVVTGDAQALGTALAVVNASPARAAGVGAKLVWKVKRFVEPEPCKCCGSRRGMVPAEYWLEGPDADELNSVAAAHTSQDPNDPPVVPGVVFELTAGVTGRRK